MLDSETHCCEHSFRAMAGWDPVTGLGTPNFQLLSSIVINPDTWFPALGAFPNGGGRPSCPSHQQAGAGAGAEPLLSTTSPEEEEASRSANDEDDGGAATTTFAGLALVAGGGLLIGTVAGKFVWGRERSGASVCSEDRARLEGAEEVSLLVGIQNNHFRDYKSVESGGHEVR